MTKPMTSDSEFALQLYRLMQKFKDFNLDNEPYSYDILGFSEWLEFEEKVADGGSSTDGSANTEASCKLAPKAQSEAPSVDEILDELFAPLIDSPNLTLTSVYWKEAKAKINRLIAGAEENGILKGLYQARYATEPGSEEEQRIDNQIAELSNLSKTIAQETRYGSEIFTTMEARPLSGGWMFDDKVGNLFRYRKWWEFWKPERIYLAQPKDNLNKERLGHD